VGVRSSLAGLPAALAAGLLGLGVLTGSAAPAAGMPPQDPDRDVGELNDSIQEFAEDLLDAHADAVTAALETLEGSQATLEAAKLEAEAAEAAADAANKTAKEASRSLEATRRAERAAARTLTELSAQVAQTREQLGELARAAYRSGGGFAGWSASLEPGSLAGYQHSAPPLLSAGDDPLRELAALTAELAAAQDRFKGLRAEYQQLVQRVADVQAAAAAAMAESRAAAVAVEDAETSFAEARTSAELARDEESRRYEEFLAESEALEAWLAEYSISDRLEGTGSFVRPGTGPVTSPFGPRMHPILGYVKTHTGMDIGRGDGFIYAADHGVVAEATWNDAYGYLVIVDHGVIDGNRVSTLYAHQPGLSVDVGDKVAKGQPIGSVGSTGLSTGPHLHFEVRIEGRPVNPWPWISDAPLPADAGR
jgi:murein DD-endopeptidase MepM/ murein hydrolase activator NlpD